MATDRLVERLSELGFSTYEARAYVGLVKAGTVTGYALANFTGIPQPKVYETLRRLADRGAAIKIADDPARFSALPAVRLLEQLEEEFEQRLVAARTELEQIEPDVPREWHESLERMDGYKAVKSAAEAMIDKVEDKLYLSGWAENLEDMKEAILGADERGVQIVVLHFGDLNFEISNGQTYRHASTEGLIYRHHRSRQLAVIGDSATSLWALAPDGDDWSAIHTGDQRIVMLTKAYLRHDIYVQKIYGRFGEEMRETFGPGLEFLTDVANDDTLKASKGQRRAAG